MSAKSVVGAARFGVRVKSLKYGLLATAFTPLAAMAQGVAPGSAPQATATQGLEEIVVTSQKVAQTLSKVPISVTALTQQALDVQKIETPDDLSKVAPGLVFISNAGTGEQRNNQIFIRGIESGNGVPTIGIYIDDTPLTIRTIATGGTNSFYPNFFDLDRIEVLRGPQGTLFGVGSEAGTVRFITTAPNLETFSGSAKSDFGFTDGGDPSYEDGVAVGGPIVRDKIGFRASVYYREDGGYIDRKDIYTNAVTEQNDNRTMTYSGRLALEIDPVDDLEITPTIFAQREIGSGVPRTYPATTFTTPTGQTLNFTGGNFRPNSDDLRDQFVLGSLAIKYDGLDWMRIQSNTSYTYRQQLETDDLPWINLFGLTTPFVPGDPGYSDRSPDQNWEHTISQELRFTSNNDADSPWFWQGGVYYTRTNQSSTQYVYSNTFNGLANALTGIFPHNFASLIGFNQATDYDVYVHQVVQDQQESAFGELHYKVLPEVTLRAGLRIEYDSSAFGTQEGGPVGDGSGPGLQTPYPLVLQSETDHPVIPKFGIDWQIDTENLLYVTVAKGSRLGGPNTVPSLVSPVCTNNLHDLGLSSIPETFKPDHVWSYELGTKNRFFDDHLQVDASAYYIDWENVQQSISIGCPTPFFANLGAATSKGFELSVTGRPTTGLTLSANIGYTDATFSDTIASGSLLIAKTGDPLPNVLPWTAHISAEYDMPLDEDRMLYFRGDYQWLDSEPKGDPKLVGWDPTIQSNGTFAPNPAYGLLNLRSGVQFGGADASVYILNATDKNPRLSYARDQPLTTSYYKENEIRPITVGFTVSYKFTQENEPEAEAAPYAPPPAVAPAAASVAHSYMVFFDFDKSDLTPQALAIVDQAAQNAGPAKVTEIQVTGHTDTVGSDAYNMRLSRRRAEAVAAELEKKGVPESEIAIFAKGKRDLLVPTGDGVKEPQNRRVQIVYAAGATS
jgi:outer membrane receptor protein involved in Fe transport